METSDASSKETVSYRWRSSILVAALVLAPMVALAMDAPRWAAVLIFGLPVYVTLIVTTWRRLRAVRLSQGWIVLMLVVIHIGPYWEGPWESEFYLTDLIALIPVALGWFTRGPRPAALTA
ncbi:hypothetical protein [Brevundimonas sp.]|uniref:hypothetical protein n=1 Tax=Brevundimonas sp. TaxID=1871086 RepID=UPI003F6F72CB